MDELHAMGRLVNESSASQGSTRAPPMWAAGRAHSLDVGFVMEEDDQEGGGQQDTNVPVMPSISEDPHLYQSSNDNLLSVANGNSINSEMRQSPPPPMLPSPVLNSTSSHQQGLGYPSPNLRGPSGEPIRSSSLPPMLGATRSLAPSLSFSQHQVEQGPSLILPQPCGDARDLAQNFSHLDLSKFMNDDGNVAANNLQASESRFVSDQVCHGEEESLDENYDFKAPLSSRVRMSSDPIPSSLSESEDPWHEIVRQLRACHEKRDTFRDEVFSLAFRATPRHTWTQTTNTGSIRKNTMYMTRRVKQYVHETLAPMLRSRECGDLADSALEETSDERAVNAKLKYFYKKLVYDTFRRLSEDAQIAANLLAVAGDESERRAAVHENMEGLATLLDALQGYFGEDFDLGEFSMPKSRPVRSVSGTIYVDDNISDAGLKGGDYSGSPDDELKVSTHVPPAPLLGPASGLGTALGGLGRHTSESAMAGSMASSASNCFQNSHGQISGDMPDPLLQRSQSWAGSETPPAQSTRIHLGPARAASTSRVEALANPEIPNEGNIPTYLTILPVVRGDPVDTYEGTLRRCGSSNSFNGGPDEEGSMAGSSVFSDAGDSVGSRSSVGLRKRRQSSEAPKAMSLEQHIEFYKLVASKLDLNRRNERDWKTFYYFLSEQSGWAAQLFPRENDFKQKLKLLFQERRRRPQMTFWKKICALRDIDRLGNALQQELGAPHSLPYTAKYVHDRIFDERSGTKDRKSPGSVLTDWSPDARAEFVDFICSVHQREGYSLPSVYGRMSNFISQAEVEAAVLFKCDCESCAQWNLCKYQNDAHVFKQFYTRSRADLMANALQIHATSRSESHFINLARQDLPQLGTWSDSEITEFVKAAHHPETCSKCSSSSPDGPPLLQRQRHSRGLANAIRHASSGHSLGPSSP
mmetsp:Transcript_16198/g.31350  ORF Transcript_16198/g.31350 Transcript_16198/m.31350 type:complete len:924 (-) Transcript_16198:401-3172(-)|eukprot:CAMPEP_0171492420 /NCGR_PEP_ID=MMETSP0958-20121227/4400_1 /TAXON_ID=87120 /ORGANISM="Aurantiochytrium limacinum, Strain ATCCMYA-1381" /LENGTH=923 /DNA_ID=CAMNT_0012025937 /DNA_START=159 /DNA_END=2930 /DNA_ORIENTATION=+